VSHPVNTGDARRRRGAGQILVIVAGGLIGLLAIGSIAVEGGSIALNQRDAQNAADLAAVAGARMIALARTEAEGSSNARSAVFGAIASTLDANGCSSTDPCTWRADFVDSGLSDDGRVRNTSSNIPGSALGVRVRVTRTPGAILGRVLGFETWLISTEGTALMSRPSSVPEGTLLPIAICGWSNPASNECDPAQSPDNAVEFNPGQIYDLANGKDGPRGFGWVSWGGGGAGSFCEPNNPALTFDGPYDDPGGSNETWLRAATPGLTIADVSSCLDSLIARRNPVMVPVYDELENGAYHITGVAAFVLTSRGTPARDTIQGYVVEYVPFAGDPEASGIRSPDAGDMTVYIGLVR
jgi:hypothetical protein